MEVKNTGKGRGRGWRLVTWLIVGWTVVMGALEYMLYAQIGATKDADVGISAGIGMVVLFFGWLFGFLVLWNIWSRTKPDGPAA
jgi:hypothetical protein